MALNMLDGSLLLRVNLPVVDAIHPQLVLLGYTLTGIQKQRKHTCNSVKPYQGAMCNSLEKMLYGSKADEVKKM